jgi:hypothetical protein
MGCRSTVLAFFFLSSGTLILAVPRLAKKKGTEVSRSATGSQDSD